MNPILSKIFQLNNIIELDASSVYLELLPLGIENLSSLKKLTLIETSLKELPPEIGQLQSLQILNLRMNELKAIPSEIGQLENLEELYLGENRIITKLPNSIGNLRNLRTFKINDQQLRLDPRYVDLLPDTIGQLSALTYLDVSEAYITRLPDTIGDLQNIRELNISGNYITRLPESLINIITSNNLVSINVTYLEQLEDIPTTLKDPFSKLMTKAGVVFEADHEFKELLMEDDE